MHLQSHTPLADLTEIVLWMRARLQKRYKKQSFEKSYFFIRSHPLFHLK